MNEHQDDQPATYDVRATQDKWLPVWDELDPFRARRRLAAGEALRADDVPLPVAATCTWATPRCSRCTT